MLLALVVLVLTIAAVVLLATSMSVDHRQAQQEAVRLRLDVLEDAAMAEALAALAASPTFVGDSGTRFDRGVISSVVEMPVGMPPSRRRVTAMASIGGRTRSLVAEVLLTLSGPRVLSWSEEPGG